MLVKTAFQVSNPNFLPSVRNKLFIFFTSKILREICNKKILFYKLSVQYLVVKPAYVNAILRYSLFHP